MSGKRDIPKVPVDFADMQGLVRFGHGRLTEAEFLLLKVADAKAARIWLGAAPITSAEWQPEPPKVAMQIAFTASGLGALGLDRDVVAQFSQPFLSGMAGEDSRSRRLGDTGANDPSGWLWNGAQVHILLMLYAKRGGLEAFKASVLDKKFERAFDLLHALPTAANDGIEPFGFADGISEPKVDWDQDFPPRKHGRSAYSNMLAPGEVVLGYVNEYKELPPSPRVEPTGADAHGVQDLGRNGTYLVLRHLDQDVPGFWQFADTAAGGDAERRETLAAAMVGRHRDGTPLIADSRDIEGGLSGNNFTFDSDPNGRACPLGAHIRRANPRTGDQPAQVDSTWAWLMSTLGFRRRRDGLPGRHDLVASTRFHRLVRRGRAFGPKLSPEDALKAQSDDARGLYFICLCADVTRQFEFVQNAWMASGTFNGLSEESDPLIGNREPMNGVPTDGFSLQRVTGVAERHEHLPQFVAVRGGGYFFLPSLRALRFIAGHTD